MSLEHLIVLAEQTPKQQEAAEKREVRYLQNVLFALQIGCELKMPQRFERWRKFQKKNKAMLWLSGVCMGVALLSALVLLGVMPI